MRSSSASSVTSVLSAQNVLYERQRKIKLVGGPDGRLLPSDLACTNVIATLRTSPEPAGSHRLQAAPPVFAQLISPKSLRFISLVLNALTLIALNVPGVRYFPTGITRCCASAIESTLDAEDLGGHPWTGSHRIRVDGSFPHRRRCRTDAWHRK